MEIRRNKGMEYGYDYEFIKDNKILRILFGGNLDLYWCLETNHEFSSYEEMTKELYETFTITKDNYRIYELFKSLIEDVKTSNVFTPSPEKIVAEDEEVITLPPSYKQIKEVEERNEELKQQAGYQRIIDGDAIIWHSDEETYDIADVLRISEQDDNIILEFYRPELSGDKFSIRRPGNISIRFRNSGSYYLPFNIVFMRMFNKLQEFDPELDQEYHQIHIEEYIHTLKRGHYDSN